MRINFRYIILAVIGAVTMMAFIGECEYILGTIAVKVFGLVCLIVLCKLYRKWDKDGKIEKLTKLVNDDEY